MGRRIGNAFARDKGQSSASHDASEDDPNKTPEPYICTGNFEADFTELCRRNNMAVIPPVVPRPHRPPSPSQAPPPEDTKRGKKGDDKKNQPPPEPEPEPLLDENGDPIDPPPKTYTTKDKYEYFKPRVHVEMEKPEREKHEAVTEIHIRGWKVDEPMMTIFKQCWPKLDHVHTINLWNTGLQEGTIQMLASFLPECHNVRRLMLDNNPVPQQNYHLLMGEDSPVQHLSLRYNQVTDKGAALIGNMLGNTACQNQNLLSLNLTGNQITDVGAESISKGLRMNRILLCLSLSNNKIGDQGAKKIAETISRFSLSHEEIVVRRKLMSEKGATDSRKSPLPGGKGRSDSRDRPGSVRSTHNKDKPGKSAKPKKETKGKEEATTKGKKEQDKTVKKASVVADMGKTGKKDGKKDKRKPAPTESEGGSHHVNLNILNEPADTPELVNPLLDSTQNLDDGTIMLTGNRMLISLNLAHNEIGEEGVKAFHLAVGYQTSLSQFTSHTKGNNTGLMRLSLSRNKVSPDNEYLQKLNAVMGPKDPLYKPPPTSPDQESQG